MAKKLHWMRDPANKEKISAIRRRAARTRKANLRAAAAEAGAPAARKVTAKRLSVIKGLNRDQIKALATLGAAARLGEIAEEARTLLNIFPELRK